MADYLLAEVLERQSEQVRRLLLRTSVLERVSGPLADALTGDSGGERVLQDLEEANAFVVALDAGRAWFRYHHLFADLLQLELRRTAPGEVTGLHRVAAQWFAEHGFAVEAIRHAQAAQDWGLAARLLAEHWPGLHLDGQAAVIHELLAGFPHEARVADAELAAVAAGDELAQGSLEAAERYLALAERAPVPDGRQGQARLLAGIVRLLLARQRGNPQTAAEEAERLRAFAEAPETAQPGLGEELRALALISLGITEYWAAGPAEAERHLEQGRILAHRIGRPFLEVSGLAHQAATEGYRSFARAEEYSMSAIELAERHGWTDEPAAGIAYWFRGTLLAWQGRLEEAGPWVQRAERVLRAEAEPAAVLGVQYVRGLLELGRGRDADALAAFQAVERLAGGLATPQYLLPAARALLVHALVRLGETERAEQALAGFGDQDRGEICIAAAVLRLARHDPRAALAALAPVLAGSAPLLWPTWLTMAFLLEAIAREALGDGGAADQALERALDCAEPDGALVFFLWHPVPGLLQRHARGCARHAALVSETLTLLTPEPGSPDPVPRGHAGPKEVRRSGEPPRDQGGLGVSFPRADRAGEPQRDAGAALPADESARPGDRPGTVSVGDHRPDAHKPPVRQARRPPPHRGRRAGPRSGPARTIPHAPRWSAPRNRIIPGPALPGVNVATTWPASALAPGLANHHARWPPGSACPDFARLGGPTALGIASANTLTPVNHHNYTMQTHLAGHDAWKCPSKTGRSIRQPRLSSAAARHLPCISFSDEDREGNETMAEQTGPVWYEIRVRGVLGKTLLGAFPGMCARAHEKETVLCGPVADQAALYGVLAEIEALGLELLELRRTRD